MNLKEALEHPLWMDHNIGDTYSMTHSNGKQEGGWKIAYYPLFGTQKDQQWIEYPEPRALVEKPFKDGIDLREIPLRFLTKEKD